MSINITHSAVYTGWVRHRRFSPVSNTFTYPVFMMYLDLNETDEVFRVHPLLSQRRFSPIRFNREDYFGDATIPLQVAVKQKVADTLGVEPEGSVRMLTNLRFFGFIINPITVYYCFNANDELEAMMLDVTNTPWKESFQYVLRCDPIKRTQRISFHKAHHVSPFQPMTVMYDWRSSQPADKLAIHMNSKQVSNENEKYFDATLGLNRCSVGIKTISIILWQYPFNTLIIFIRIYWQALKLFCKRVPFFRHPKKYNIQPSTKRI